MGIGLEEEKHFDTSKEIIIDMTKPVENVNPEGQKKVFLFGLII